MTFDPSIPDAATSPGLLPITAATNWGRLEALLGADHQFNDTAAGTDGFHKISHWMNEGAAVAASAGVGQLYTRTATGPNSVATEHLAYVAGTATASYPECFLSMFPVRAAAIFPALGVGAFPRTLTPVGTVYNVGTILQTAVSTYTVAFPAGVFNAAFAPLTYAFPLIIPFSTSAQMTATVTSMTPTLLTFQISEQPGAAQIRLMIFGG